MPGAGIDTEVGLIESTPGGDAVGDAVCAGLGEADGVGVGEAGLADGVAVADALLIGEGLGTGVVVGTGVGCVPVALTA